MTNAITKDQARHLAGSAGLLSHTPSPLGTGYDSSQYLTQHGLNDTNSAHNQTQRRKKKKTTKAVLYPVEPETDEVLKVAELDIFN